MNGTNSTAANPECRSSQFGYPMTREWKRTVVRLTCRESGSHRRPTAQGVIMSQTRILALVGSLRAGSINRQLAEAAAQTAPEGVEVDIYDGLGNIPFYNEDIDVPGQVP